MNPKFHRRSKSVGRVLDHQPVVQVPLGTVYQKVLPGNAKSTTRPKADDLKKCDEYLITHQEVDNRGNISTELVKVSQIMVVAGVNFSICRAKSSQLQVEVQQLNLPM